MRLFLKILVAVVAFSVSFVATIALLWFIAAILIGAN